MRMFVCLNSKLGVFVLYKKEEHYPTKPYRIYDLTILTKLTRKLDSMGSGAHAQMYYFELQLQNVRKRFYSEN